MPRTGEKIHLRSTGWLVLSTLAGIPLGLLLLTAGNQHLVKGSLAVIIMAFSAYALMGRRPPELHSDSRIWLLGCGFCAGVLGGAYGMNGPPLAIYGAMRRWSAQHFRATLQGYFLPASIIGMAGYFVAGLWVPLVTRYYLLSLPLTIPAIFLGRVVNRRLHGEVFLKYVHVGLLLIGAAFAGPGCSSVVPEYAVLRYFPRQAILPLCLRPCRQRPRSFPNTR